jgi:flagellar biosynthetic protein FliS
MTRTDLAYRKTAVEGASGFGLLIALFDTLASDLRRAAEAERNNAIEKRSSEVKHALLVLGYLEDWLKRGSEGELAEKLTAFYATLRRKLIDAQVNRSATLLEEQMASVLKIREYWQQADSRGMPTGPDILRPATASTSAGYTAMATESRRSSWAEPLPQRPEQHCCLSPPGSGSSRPWPYRHANQDVCLRRQIDGLLLQVGLLRIQLALGIAIKTRCC